jgi:hypothetical protein
MIPARHISVALASGQGGDIVHAGPGVAASEAIVDPMRIESRLQDDLDATIRLIAERLVPLLHTLAREAQVEVNYEMTKAEALDKSTS